MTYMKFLRVDKGDSMQDVADHVSGLTAAQVGLIERRRINPTPAEREGIARVLGCDPDALLQEVTVSVGAASGVSTAIGIGEAVTK